MHCICGESSRDAWRLILEALIAQQQLTGMGTQLPFSRSQNPTFYKLLVLYSLIILCIVGICTYTTWVLPEATSSLLKPKVSLWFALTQGSRWAGTSADAQIQGGSSSSESLSVGWWEQRGWAPLTGSWKVAAKPISWTTLCDFAHIVSALKWVHHIS